MLGVPDMPTRAELEEREAQMRLRATELLGRPPGADPAGELRALRVPTEGRAEMLDEIAEMLREHGLVVTGDLLEYARAFLASNGNPEVAAAAAAPPPPSAPPPEVPTVPVPAANGADRIPGG